MSFSFHDMYRIFGDAAPQAQALVAISGVRPSWSPRREQSGFRRCEPLPASDLRHVILEELLVVTIHTRSTAKHESLGEELVDGLDEP